MAIDRTTRWGASFGSSMPEQRPTSGAFRTILSGLGRSAFRGLYARTTARHSRIGSSDWASVLRQGHMSSTGSALTTDSSRQNLPGPTAWQSARVAVSGRSCKVIVSNRMRHWSPCSTAMFGFIISGFPDRPPNRPREAKSHCRRCRIGTNSDRNCSRNNHITFRDGTSRSFLTAIFCLMLA